MRGRASTLIDIILVNVIKEHRFCCVLPFCRALLKNRLVRALLRNLSFFTIVRDVTCGVSEHC